MAAELTKQESADSLDDSPRQPAPQAFNPLSGSHCSNPQRSPLADVPEHPSSPSPDPSSSSPGELKPGQNKAAWDVQAAMQETAQESHQQAEKPHQSRGSETKERREESLQSKALSISPTTRSIRRSFSETSRPRPGRMQSPFASFARLPIPETPSLDMPRDAFAEQGHHRPTKSAGQGLSAIDVSEDSHLDGQHESMHRMGSSSGHGKAEGARSKPVQFESQASTHLQPGIKQAVASSLYQAASHAFGFTAAQPSKLESQGSRSFTDGNSPVIKSSRHFERNRGFQDSSHKSPEKRRNSDEAVRSPHRLQFASGPFAWSTFMHAQLATIALKAHGMCPWLWDTCPVCRFSEAHCT